MDESQAAADYKPAFLAVCSVACACELFTCVVLNTFLYVLWVVRHILDADGQHFEQQGHRTEQRASTSPAPAPVWVVMLRV